jgi:hypothetical protein
VWIYVTVGPLGGGGAAFVVIVSITCLLPPAPVAVQVQVDGNPTHALLAVPGALPLVASEPLATKPVPVPVELQTRVSDVALLVLQFSVKDWFATIGVGVRVTLSVGAAVGGGGGGAVTLIWYAMVGAPKNSTFS